MQCDKAGSLWRQQGQSQGATEARAAQLVSIPWGGPGQDEVTEKATGLPVQQLINHACLHRITEGNGQRTAAGKKHTRRENARQHRASTFGFTYFSN